MKAIVFASLILGSLAASAAIESTTLSCQQIRSAIARNGWQVVQTNGQPAGNKAAYATLYATADCSGDSRAATATVLDKDGGQCFAGEVCVRSDFYGIPTNLDYQSWL